MSRALATAVLALSLASAMASWAQAESRPTPDEFVAAANGSDQYEIMAARIALVESKDPMIRSFATEMIRDHMAANTALVAAAEKSGVAAPSSNVGGDQAMLLAALQSARGADFDRTYARQQGLAHQQALVTMQAYIRTGSDASLRAAAQADLPMIEHHLQAARNLPLL